MGSREDVMARINKNTEAHLEQMSQEMEKNKEKVNTFNIILVIAKIK